MRGKGTKFRRHHPRVVGVDRMGIGGQQAMGAEAWKRSQNQVTEVGLAEEGGFP